MIAQALRHFVKMFGLGGAQQLSYLLQKLVGRKVLGADEDAPRHIPQSIRELMFLVIRRPVSFEYFRERPVCRGVSFTIERIHCDSHSLVVTGEPDDRLATIRLMGSVYPS